MTDGNVNSMILTIVMQVTINISKNPASTRLFLKSGFGQFFVNAIYVLPPSSKIFDVTQQLSLTQFTF